MNTYTPSIQTGIIMKIILIVIIMIKMIMIIE